MKNKLSKFFVAFLSTFLLFGGVIFTACGEAPKATIFVSSQDFVGEDYIEIDLGSDKTSAQITATVEGVSSGRVSVNNDNQSIVSTNAIYNESTNSTTINIVGKSEGNASIVLRSYEGSGQKVINIYVYSDILGVEQKQDSDGSSNQYVVKGEATVLDSDRFLTFTSREGGESNRKDVTWELVSIDENITLEGNVLTVGEESSLTNVLLKAVSVYKPEYFAEVNLAVITSLPGIQLDFSRDPNSFSDLIEENESFNIVKNDDSQEEAVGYVRMVVGAPTGGDLPNLKIDRVVTDLQGNDNTRISITTYNTSVTDTTTQIIYQIKATANDANTLPEVLNVRFDVGYENFSYTKSSVNFQINLVDVIDKIEVTSDGQTITSGDVLDIYDNYNGDSSYQFGRPFVVNLGPDTVANDQALFDIEFYAEGGLNINNYIRIFNERGQQILLQEKNGVYVAEGIANNSLIYIKTAENFVEATQIKCKFVSQQSPNVNLEANLVCYRSPNANFSIGSQAVRYLSTYGENTIQVEVSSNSLIGINKGLSLSEVQSDLFEISNFSFDSATGTIRFNVSNIKQNVSNENLSVSLYIKHENGYRSIENIVIAPYLPIVEASVTHQGQSSTSISQVEYQYQDFGALNASYSLQSLIMKLGSSVTLNLNTNSATGISFAFRYYENASADNINSDNLNEILDLFNKDETEQDKYATFDYSTNRLTLASNDFKGYVLFTFTGYDNSHGQVLAYRIFYLESYTPPTKLSPTPSNVTLTALDSIAQEEKDLAETSISLSYRVDGNGVTYSGDEYVGFRSVAGQVGVKNGDYIQFDNYDIENIKITNKNITFDITAKTTNGYESFTDQIEITYTIFGISYYATIDLVIENAERVEVVEWENASSDGIIYLDLYGNSTSDITYPLVTSVQPGYAHNTELAYTFVPDAGTQPDLIQINDLGVVSIKPNASEGGTGYVYIYPKDAVRVEDGIEQFVYYTDNDGKTTTNKTPLTQLHNYYDQIISGYYNKIDGLETTKVYYSQFIKKIEVVVADGLSEETATRIYNETQLKNIQTNRHYVLMNSLTLNNWNSLAQLTGSLRGNDQNVVINFAGASKPLFDSIAEQGSVKQFTFAGNVTGGGFVANSNAGEINNITVAVNSTQTTVSPSKVTGGFVKDGKTFGGAIAGYNTGAISDVKVEGASIELTETMTYAGLIAGYNSGTISNAYAEFYVFSSSSQEEGGETVTTNITNLITAQYAGGFIGYMAGGEISHSYVYNYDFDNSSSTKNPLTNVENAITGAFAGYSESGSVINSFSMIYNGIAEKGEGTLNKSDVYWGYGASYQSQNNNSNWIFTGDATNFKQYVRNGEAHLTFYQDDYIASVTDFNIQDTNQSVKVNDNAGLLYVYKLRNSSNLSDSQNSELTSYNTISLTELFGESGNNLVAVSSNNNIAEVVGNNIILKDVGDFTFTISCKQNYTLTKAFNIKVLYLIEDFTISHNNIETSGFTIQEGKSEVVDFSTTSVVYLRGQAYNLMLNSTKINMTLADDSLKDYVDLSTNGMVGNITVKSGTKEFLGNKSSFTINADVSVNNLADEYNQAIMNSTKRTLSITPVLGANDIRISADSLNIVPSYDSKLEVELVTDEPNDDLILSIMKDGTQTYLVQRTEGNNLIYSFAGEDVINIHVSRSELVESQGKILYNLTISIAEEYRSTIMQSEGYTLIVSSKTGTTNKENSEIKFTLSSQPINHIDITNYKAGNTTSSNGVNTYSRTDEVISVISPGRSSIMDIVIDPNFAYYEYMTLTYENSDGEVLGITKMNKVSGTTSQYTTDTSSNVSYFKQGVRVGRVNDGFFAFRLTAAGNISKDTTFILSANFYDADGKLVCETTTYELYISYLPEAEITINGDVSSVVAKGGNLQLTILLRNDQTLDALIPENTSGITIAPESTWQKVDNGNGTYTLTANLYANLDAGVLTGEMDQNQKPIVENGEFSIRAQVSRTINGVQEIKTSYAYITIVDFLPSGADVYGTVYNENLGIDVLSSYIGIPVTIDFDYSFKPETYSYDNSNPNEINLATQLYNARNEFSEKGYYINDNKTLSINYKDGKAVPIYERLYINNQKLNFLETSEGVWTYSNSNFRLTYREGSEGQSGILTVLGLVTTSSPIQITLKDTMVLSSSGKNVSYPIETTFGVNVVVYSDQDLPLLIEDAEDFLQVAQEGTAQDYILMNDIYLQNYTPISAANFKSLDGNGHTIHIESFNTQGSGTLNLALFTDIPTGSIIKNTKVNYYSGGNITVDTTSSGYSVINIAGFAITNNGTITNCEVVAYEYDGATVNNGDVGITVNYVRGSTPYYIGDSSITSNVAGFVITNAGNITNSKVGGDEIIVVGEQIEDTNRTTYSTVSLPNFVLSAQGQMAGFVLTNSGEIATSGVKNIQITNNASLTTSQTGGFAVSNSGEIRTSYVEAAGENAQNEDVKSVHLKETNISSKGVVSGFVVNNSTSGVVSDGYSNILIKNDNEIKSRTSAGFVYTNEGYIVNSLSASYVEMADLLQLSFSGVDRNGNSLNSGKIELSYYINEDYNDDSASDVQNVISNQATLVDKNEIKSSNAYYGFIFTSEGSTEDGVWMMSDYGPRLVSTQTLTISHRYYVADPNEDDVYYLPYAILENTSDSSATKYNTAYGNSINPILITSALDLRESMGDSTSTYISAYFNDTEIFGAYRFVSDIDLSQLNNEQGNAEVKSIDKTFSGIIDGNGFAVNNISIRSSNNSVGLFGQAQNAIIKNLDIVVDNVTASNSYVVGGLVGLVQNSTIININLTQNVSDNTSSGVGVLGRNIAGGIVGAAFGDTTLNGLTGNNVIVQASYYDDNASSNQSSLSSMLYRDGFNPTLIRNSQRQNINNFYSNNLSNGGVGQVSFAGGIVGYLDIYNTLEASYTGFVYSGNSGLDYSVTKLLTQGSVDVRGEIAGGVFGYTGYQTKAQDIGIKVAKGTGTYASILSYNYFAGGIAGLANGQFYQVYAEHEESVQSAIESSTSNYYINGANSTERGVLDLFKYTGQSGTGEYRYYPKYVGGLMGVMGSGSIYVGYNKLNAINYTTNGVSYAGGVAGAMIAGSSYYIDNNATQLRVSTNLYLQEVYSTGDVFAYGGEYGDGGAITQSENHAFGGLFGVIEENAKLVMSSVNSFAHYGLLDNPYYSQSAVDTTKAVVYAVAGWMEEGSSVTVMPSTTAISSSEGGGASEITSLKSFGYMDSYSANGVKITVEPYVGYSEASDKDYYFVIAPVSSFTSQNEGFTITNGAFINSKAWSNENWIHKTGTLYPEINFVNTVNYIYLDQNNIEIVLDRMQNSSIEVRVRGRYADSDSYGMIDLRGYNLNIEGFTGTIVGFTSSSDWGVDNSPSIIHDTPYYGETAQSKGSGYPGIIIDEPLFGTTGSGLNVKNLNIVVAKSESAINDLSITGGIISNTQVIDASFEGIKLYVRSPMEISAVSSSAGLLVPSAVNTSFRNIQIIFCCNAGNNGGSGSGSSYIEFNDADGDNGSKINNAGLLAGSVSQNSVFEALRIQDITIKHSNLDNFENIFQVNATSGDICAGLYVGSLNENVNGASTDDGSSTEPSEPTTPAQNYAGMVIEVKAPELTGTVTEGSTLTSSISIAGTVSNFNLGGYFGEISSQNARLTLTTKQSYSQTVVLSVNTSASSAQIGGIAGSATLQNFEVNNTSTRDSSISTSIQLGNSNSANYKLSSTNIGLLFGKAEGSFNVQNLDVNGILQTFGDENTYSQFNGTLSIGGIIGENHATLGVVSNVDVSFEAFKNNKALLSKTDFEANSANSIDIESVNFGGFIGLNYSSVNLVSDSNGNNNTYNFDGDNYVGFAAETTTTLNVGDLIGSNQGNSVKVESFESNSITAITTTQGNGGIVNIGGMIGSTLYDSNDSNDSQEIAIDGGSSKNKVKVLSNFFINSQNVVNAGGIIGYVNNLKDSTSETIQNVVFGGAFKFNVTNTNATHSIGGIIGKIFDENENTGSITVKDTVNYGDVIYSYTDSGNSASQVGKYYFGGIAGQSGNTTSNITAEGNIIAFTNNNPRLASSEHMTSSLIGDGGSANLTGKNYYSSQLVLAVSDNKNMLDTAYANASNYAGFGETNKNTSIAQLLSSVVTGDLGTKFNPITTEQTAGVANTNGITYYAGVYPSDNATNFAYIGDFATKTQPISTVGEHSFVSGLVVDNNYDDESNTYNDVSQVGGLVNNLNGGIIFGSSAKGTLSVGGNGAKNIGGLVGLMQGGLIAESTSSVNIVYRAGKSGTDLGTVSGIASTSGTEYNYFSKTYSTGEVASYISANVYAFTNGLNSTTSDCYTISKVNQKDYTQEKVTGTTGVFGSATAHANAGNWYDGNATEVNENVGASATNTTSGKTLNYNNTAETSINGWKQNIEFNYGYPTRNFAAFNISTTETIDNIKFYLIPNATKLALISTDTTKNYKLVRDIDLSKTSSYVSAWPGVEENSAIIDGDGHTINGPNATLFSSVATIKNLRVTNATVEGDAVVASTVTGSADNIIASGTLTGSGTNIGGLFGDTFNSSEPISNCKNYVKIDASEGSNIGGIVGYGAQIVNCYNYSPISVNSVGSYVGGIAGTAVSVKNCGNENTVFNGYTTTDSGNYYAGGIAGNATTVTSCYNTSMVKAGNKNINADGNASSGTKKGVSYAAGIVAQGKNVSECENSGFVEALGSTEKNVNSYGLILWEQKEKGMVAWVVNNDNIINVYANGLGLDNGNEISGDSNKNAEKIYRNGLYAIPNETYFNNEFVRHTSEELFDNDNIVTVPENEPGITKTQSTTKSTKNIDLGNGITIGLNNCDFQVAELDELGGISKYYVKTTRSITYNGSVTKTQTRYWEVKEVQNTYADSAWIEADSTVNNLSLINENDEQSTGEVTTVYINGSPYAFVENGKGLLDVLSGNMATKQDENAIDNIGGISVKTLYDVGYKFVVNITDHGNGIDNVSGKAEYKDGKVYVTVNYSFTGSGNSNIEYTVSAYREDYIETMQLNASNLLIDGGKLTIKLNGGYNLTKDRNYTIKVDDQTNYIFTYNGTDLVYSGSDNDNALNNLQGKTITLNLNEGEIVTDQKTMYLTYTSSNGWSQSIQGSYSNTSSTYERITQYVAENDAGNNNARDVIISSNQVVDEGSVGDERIKITLTRVILGKVTSISLNGGLNWSSGNRTIALNDTSTRLEFKHAAANGYVRATQFEYDSASNKTYLTLYLRRDIRSFPENLKSDWSAVTITYNFDNSYVDSPYGSTETKTYTAGNDSITATFKANGNANKYVSAGSRSGAGKNSTINYENYYYTQNYKLDNISINVAENQWVTYSYGSNSTEIITNGSKNVISFSNLNGLGSSLVKTVFKISGAQSTTYDYNYDDLILDGDNATTAIVYTQDPILINESSYAQSDVINSTTGGSGTVEFGGITYNFEINSNGVLTSFKQGENVWEINEGITFIENKDNCFYYNIIEDAESETYSLQMFETYKGSNCVINVKGNNYSYKLKENGNFEIIGGALIDADGLTKVELGGVIYLVEDYTTTSEPIKANIENGKFIITKNEDGKSIFTYEDANLKPNQYILFNVNYKQAEEKITLTLENNVINDVYANVPAKNNGDLFNNASYTINGQSSTDTTVTSVGPFTYDAEIKVTATYKNKESGSQTVEVNFGSEDKTNYLGIVLTKDVNLKNVSSIYSLSINFASKNENIVNFISTTKNGLFESTSDELFIKDVNFAGTVVVSNISNNAGILAVSLSSNINNLKTYGTISTASKNDYVKSGGVAGIISASLTNISNFTSFSNTLYNSDMAGIAGSGTTELKNVSGSLCNYGTIIGVRGADGASAGEDGQEGQDVYAISHVNIESNSVNIYNFGIVKAGDGGNGRRGADGQGGTDKTNGTAPTNGTFGATEGGKKGEAGKAYYFDTNKNTHTASEQEPYVISGTLRDGLEGLYDGSRGNDGWGGLNLYLNFEKHDGPENRIDVDENNWTYHANLNAYRNGSVSNIQNTTNGEIIAGIDVGIAKKQSTGWNGDRITFIGKFNTAGKKIEGTNILSPTGNILYTYYGARVDFGIWRVDFDWHKEYFFVVGGITSALCYDSNGEAI